MKPSLARLVIKNSALPDAEEGEITGSQQSSAFICDFNISLTGTAAPVPDHGPGGHGTAAGGTDEIQAPVQGDVISSIGTAGGSAGAVSHRIIGTAMKQAVRIQDSPWSGPEELE